jgi:NAD(P)H-hydrate epimerase
MRSWENASWAAGKSQAEVISRVGKIIAARVLELTTPQDLVLILAGKGHNGDDARSAAEALKERCVALCNISEPKSGIPLIEAALAKQPSLIVDGLFGIGLNRPLNLPWRNLIRRVNACGLPILAVDVPSGLDADTGKPQGESIRANITVTLGAPKRGLLAMSAWPFVGRLELAPEIGLIPCPAKSELNWGLASDFVHYPPARPAQGHKGDFGHLAIVSGSLGFHGAAVLTARGAQRAQPGLITLFTQQDVYAPVAAQLQSVMVSSCDKEPAIPAKTTAILIGPGLAAKNLPPEIKHLALSLWKQSPMPMVVDASALDWLPGSQTNKQAVRVVTPHPGEAARLLGASVDKVQKDRVGALREISKMLGNCHVVLKGAQTLIGRSAGPVLVNSSGNPGLAQGGSGDLLAGYIAGLLAQPLLARNPEQAIAYAVWQHGHAADRLGASRGNWTVEELANEIGNPI